MLIPFLILENWKAMQDFVESHVHQPGIYRDIVDGNTYQRKSAAVTLEGRLPISIYWHLGGASGQKSKSVSLWPSQSFVVELPLTLRYSYKNCTLVW